MWCVRALCLVFGEIYEWGFVVSDGSQKVCLGSTKFREKSRQKQVTPPYYLYREHFSSGQNRGLDSNISGLQANPGMSSNIGGLTFFKDLKWGVFRSNGGAFKCMWCSVGFDFF